MRTARTPILEGFTYPYDGSWRQVREPGADVAQILALIAGMTLCVTTYVAWLLLVPLKPIRIDYMSLLVALFIVVVLHELTHAVAFTWKGGRERRVEIAWRKHRPLIRYEGSLSRARYVGVLVAPYLVISLGPIVLAVVLHLGAGDLVLLSLVNALFSGADLVALVVMSGQVPARAIMRRQNDAVLWKPRRVVAPAPAATRTHRAEW